MTAITRRTQAWHRASTIADRQHGVLAREQLRSLGFKDGAISHAVTTGRLHRVFRGAYALGHSHIGERGRLMAATLACGNGAVVSYRSAGALLGLLDNGPAVIDVIAPPSHGRGIDGIYLHRVRPPRLEETGTFDRIPCTSPARTLVDLAGTVGEWTLRSAFERAARKEWLDLAAIEASIDPRRRGMKMLLKLIDEWRGAAPLLTKRGKLKSPLEAKVLPLIVGRDLPPPLFNAPVQIAKGRVEVDFLWPDHHFALEADSRDFHATHIAFERDRWRDRELMRAGYSVLRVTSRQAEREAEAVADTVATRLSRSS
ncbi:MAG TPA: type IV toxin-antitoxin system AbiEi family antitoxin domain-containing protein [Solirubrobacterales bacterium]|nr:type IV toxin-antitoxin system AbiEi family antitoxin domain-containing protein [Solirubrobacterales bacterium]